MSQLKPPQKFIPGWDPARANLIAVLPNLSLLALNQSLQVATRILKTNFYSEQAGHDLLIHFWNNNCSGEGPAEGLNYIRKYASLSSTPIQGTEHIIIIIFKFY